MAAASSCVRRMLAEDRLARVLIFSMHAEALYVARALDAGARGYVSKSAPAAELVTAIQKVAAGGPLRRARGSRHSSSPSLLQRGPLRPAHDSRGRTSCASSERVKTLAVIATALGVTYKTVANSCTIIKSKLGAARVADLIRIAIELRDG